MKSLPNPLTDVERAAVERALRILAEEIDESSIGPGFVERIAELHGADLEAHALAEYAVNTHGISKALAFLSRSLRTIVGTFPADERARALAALAIADGLLDGTIPPDTTEVGDALSGLDERKAGATTITVRGGVSAALSIANGALAARGWSGGWGKVEHVTRIARYIVQELAETSTALAQCWIASFEVEIRREQQAPEQTPAVVPIARGRARRKARAA